jgi:hypothetical protein
MYDNVSIFLFAVLFLVIIVAFYLSRDTRGASRINGPYYRYEEASFEAKRICHLIWPEIYPKVD